MLESALGIRVLLWTGETIPRPHPELLLALESATVTNDADSADGFQLTFAVAKDPLGRFDLLQDGALEIMNRVWIALVIGVVPEVLIDGVITRHDLRPSNEPSQSRLIVTGSDLTARLDLEEQSASHSNQPDSVIIQKLLAKYPQFGFVPMVTTTPDTPVELDRIPRQHETDLQFIRRAAERNGFVFYIEPLSMGTNTAYWGPVVRTGLPQPGLTLTAGAACNLTSLDFGVDGLAPLAATGSFVEPITKLKVPIPALPALRLPPLASSSIPAARKTLLRDTGNTGPAQTALASTAAATAAPEAVSGTGELDTVRYGNVLRARRLVGVRGAGVEHDGLWWVRSVTHSVRRGSCTQSFSLSREGIGALLPVVRP
jgi:hypothetical protein